MAESQHAPIMTADFESSDDLQHVMTETGMRKRVAMVAVVSSGLIAIGCMVARGTEVGLRHIEPRGAEQKDAHLPPPLLPPPKSSATHLGLGVPVSLVNLYEGSWTGFAEFSKRACVEESGFVAFKQPTESRCASSCLQSSTCAFVSFCSKALDATNCVGEHENLCTHYSTCNSLGSSYKGFKTYMRHFKTTPAPSYVPSGSGAWEGFISFSHDTPAAAWTLGDPAITLTWTQSAPCHAVAISTTQVGGPGQCSQKCRDEPSCSFVAYCNNDGVCKNEHKKACKMYKSCDTLARNPLDPISKEYRVYRKVDQSLAMQKPVTAR